MPRRSHAALVQLVAAVSAVVAAGCTPSPGVGGGGPQVWTIPVGGHEAAGASVVTTTSDSQHIRFRFDASASYATVDPANQADINKLWGFSDCSTHHQTNSARVGWRWSVDRIELLAYDYVGGARQSALLGTALPGEWHDVRIDATPSGYLFTLDGVATPMARGCADTGLLKYQLWPYFGGDETAPHTITVEIESLPV